MAHKCASERMGGDHLGSSALLTSQSLRGVFNVLCSLCPASFRAHTRPAVQVTRSRTYETTDLRTNLLMRLLRQAPTRRAPLQRLRQEPRMSRSRLATVQKSGYPLVYRLLPRTIWEVRTHRASQRAV